MSDQPDGGTTDNGDDPTLEGDAGDAPEDPREAMREALREYLGPNAKDYLSFHKRCSDEKGDLKPGLQAGFNVAALLVAFAWSLYRKLYLWGIGYLVASVVLTLLFPAYAFHLNIAMSLLAAIFVNQIYVGQAIRHIREIDATGLTGEQRLDAIRARGKVSQVGGSIGGAVIISSTLLWIFGPKAGTLPPCDAREARNTATNLARNYFASQGKPASDIAISKIREAPTSNANTERHCNAVIRASGATRSMFYVLKWHGDSKTGVTLEIDWGKP